MKCNRWISGIVCLLTVPILFAACLAVNAQNKAMKSAGAGAPGMLAGLGSASGTVKAPSEFKAAKVYLKNVDKNVVYMVFTEGGRLSGCRSFFPATMK